MFKGYDVRGVYGSEVDERKFFVLGKAVAQFGDELVLGKDYREHNDSLAVALAAGFDKKIVFLGHATTPAVAWCSRKLGASLTASHNPPEYCGMKPFRERRCFYDEELSQLKVYYAREENTANTASASTFKNNSKFTGELKREGENELEKYLDSLPEFHDGIYDLGGGAACAFKKIFPRESTIFSEPDAHFSKRQPEPTDEALGALKRETLKRHALGFAFDGDADRVAVVDVGKKIDAGAAGAFYASRFLKAGDVVALTIDVSDEVCEWFEANGFQVALSAVGDINVTRKASEARAAFSMERSGHYAVTKHLLYSDALYFAALLSSTQPGEIAAFAEQFTHETLTEKIAARVNFRDLEKLFRAKNPIALETVDGIKARFDDYCILVRASRTEPIVRVSVEAADADKAVKGKTLAEALIKKVASQDSNTSF
ncbi:MAG: hypothetical protein QW343_02090 [Candidatus Norongarragalinales archaeon]